MHTTGQAASAAAESPSSPVLNKAGAVAWANFSPDIQNATGGIVKSAPIRVLVGAHHGPNKGFGRTHIETEHKKEFALCGFEAFVTDAITTFDSIFQQKDKVVALVRHGKSRLLAVLDYRAEDGGYYSVTTVFRPDPKKPIRGKLIWKKE